MHPGDSNAKRAKFDESSRKYQFFLPLSPVVVWPKYDIDSTRRHISPAPSLINVEPRKQPNKLANDAEHIIKDAISQGKSIDYLFEPFDDLMMTHCTEWEEAGEIEDIAHVLPIYTAYHSEWQEYLQQISRNYLARLYDVNKRFNLNLNQFEPVVKAYYNDNYDTVLASALPTPTQPLNGLPELDQSSQSLLDMLQPPPGFSVSDELIPESWKYNPIKPGIWAPTPTAPDKVLPETLFTSIQQPPSSTASVNPPPGS